MLFKILDLVQPDKVLVFHLRGLSSDIYGYATNLRCFGMLVMAGVNLGQPIHLHCFTGSRVMVQRWLEMFPNTHFGLTAKFQELSQEQTLALRVVPEDRLLIETDSPYLSLSGQGINTPAYAGDVASSFDDRRDISTRETLELTVKNGRRLYRLKTF